MLVLLFSYFCWHCRLVISISTTNSTHHVNSTHNAKLLTLIRVFLYPHTDEIFVQSGADIVSSRDHLLLCPMIRYQKGGMAAMANNLQFCFTFVTFFWVVKLDAWYERWIVPMHIEDVNYVSHKLRMWWISHACLLWKYSLWNIVYLLDVKVSSKWVVRHNTVKQ
jgi:hypothetical protein